jgi:uncharacterized protein (TIGR03437 family)
MRAGLTVRSYLWVIVALFVSSAFGQVNVLTDNYDNDRSNANLQESILTPANVAPGNFGKIGAFPLDGQVYAQPLYVSGVSIPGKGTRNVLYISTQHNSVFAYDADSAAAPNLLWQVNLGPSVPNTFFTHFFDVAPEIGILSTGAIDAGAGALYVVAETLQGSAPVFQLHALDLATGQEKMFGPATIAATVAGSGAGANNGTIAFDPSWEIQRTGLLLANGSVYFTFGSHADQGPWHGWLFRYSAADLSQAPSVFNATTGGVGGAIWQSGRGLPSDDAGNVYAITGNGDYDGLANFSESFLKFSGKKLGMLDWFTPSNWQYLSDNDVDLSAGAGLIPGTHLLVGGDKNGSLYLVNGDAMGGGMSGSAQVFPATQVGGVFNFAIWNKGSAAYVYIPELFANLKCYAVSSASFSTAPLSLSSGTSIDNPYLGMSISANGSQDGTGILWVTTGNHSNVNLPATLHAYDASNLANELWNSDMATGGQDSVGTFAKFANPTVANGNVYVPTWSNAITVYGLLGNHSSSQPAPAIAAVENAASYAQGAVSPGGIVTIFGQNLAESNPASLQLDINGSVASLLGNTQVLFDGMAAPLIYVSPNQVSAIVPFGVSSTGTHVQVGFAGQMSNTIAAPVAAATPGIFTSDGSGSGQAAALNSDYSVNSGDNPAAAGSIMILYATGSGQSNPSGVDGSVVSADNLPVPVQDVSVLVGGQPAAVLYAGGAPYEVEGVLQINIQLPAGVTGTNVPVVLKVGDASSKSGVTLAVQ